MADQPKRERKVVTPEVPAHAPMTSDIPEEWREGRFVTVTVGSGVDLTEMHPTEANPEARG